MWVILPGEPQPWCPGRKPQWPQRLRGMMVSQPRPLLPTSPPFPIAIPMPLTGPFPAHSTSRSRDPFPLPSASQGGDPRRQGSPHALPRSLRRAGSLLSLDPPPPGPKTLPSSPRSPSRSLPRPMAAAAEARPHLSAPSPTPLTRKGREKWAGRGRRPGRGHGC